jgi:hypothetical protein
MKAQKVALLDRETAWINLAQTARLLGVDRSTLSKQAQAGNVRCVKVGLGRGQLVVSPVEVLRLASVYRRVPLKEVKQKLAREMAVHTVSDEGAVMRALEQLHLSGTEAPVPLYQQEDDVITIVPTRTAERADKESLATIVDPSVTTPVIDLGRLRPRRVPEDDVPSEGLLQAIDARRPRQPQLEMVTLNPTVVDLGRPRPGKRR